MSCSVELALLIIHVMSIVEQTEMSPDVMFNCLIGQ
jgi:hypothetical protein